MNPDEERKLCEEIAELEFKIEQLKSQIASAMMRTEKRFERVFRKSRTYVI